MTPHSCIFCTSHHETFSGIPTGEISNVGARVGGGGGELVNGLYSNFATGSALTCFGSQLPRPPLPVAGCIFDVISSLNKFGHQ